MSSSSHTGFVTDPACHAHQADFEHPESPARLDFILSALTRAGLMDYLERIPPRLATETEIGLCHKSDYIALVRNEIFGGATQLSTGDAFVCRDSWNAALRAAGCALAATDAVFEGRARNVFAAVRPPGHHATADAGMGFCIFNNAAIAARYAQRKFGIGRVLIIDWDVHHGNGTQDIFYSDPSVFYFSTHQSPLYPGSGASGETGAGDAIGTTLNVPVPEGAGRREFIAAFKEQLMPAMKTFRPEFVIISAGFDARHGDPLGGLELTDEDFADLTSLSLDIAKEHAGGKLISLLEGGYNLAGLGSSVVAHVRALIDHI